MGLREGSVSGRCEASQHPDARAIARVGNGYSADWTRTPGNVKIIGQNFGAARPGPGPSRSLRRQVSNFRTKNARRKLAARPGGQAHGRPPQRLTESRMPRSWTTVRLSGLTKSSPGVKKSVTLISRTTGWNSAGRAVTE